MYQTKTLKNGLIVITINLPHLESVTTLVAVGAGSRYEKPANNGIAHFLEHMFFKGSRKYPTAEIISTLVDGIGAVNNAATSKEFTYYWIKSSAKHLELASDILSSQVKEPLLMEEEIEREKGVIVEEIRMYLDNPQRYVWDLYERLQFGDQPMGWLVTGDEKKVALFNRQTFLDYINSLYSPKNMALVYVGKLPEDTGELALKYFGDLPDRSLEKPLPFQSLTRTKPQVEIFYKKTDQANLVLGVEGYNRKDPRRFAAEVLGIILGEGMSSRLFLQVRERRGLAYHVAAGSDNYKDTGAFVAYAGLKLERLTEGLEVIKAELEQTARQRVSEAELQKAKEIFKGRMAIRSESTNFLGEYFGVRSVLDKKIETPEEAVRKIEAVTAAEVKKVAGELFRPERYKLQIIAPLKDKEPFEKILSK